MGILAVGVIIERYRSLKMLNADDFQVREQVQQLLFDDKIEALELCDTQQGARSRRAICRIKKVLCAA